jgi:hypothetical protein
MSLTRVRYADLAALPSLDEIKARKAAAKAAAAANAITAETDTVTESDTVSISATVPETIAAVVEAHRKTPNVSQTATVIETGTVSDTIAPRVGTPENTATVSESETVSKLGTVTVQTPPSPPVTVSDSDTLFEMRAPGKGTAAQAATVPASTNRVRRAAKVQDAHSSGEQCLYAAMWENAKPATRDYRTITAGWDRLGRLANLTSMNARAACRRLIEKLAVDMIASENSDARIGRTYRVWSWAALLARRGDAGMEWYVKTRGVEFVRPPATDPDARARWDAYQSRQGKHETETVAVSNKPSELNTVPLPVTVPETERETVPFSERGTVAFSETPLKQLRSNESISSSSLLAATPEFDDDGRHRLVRNCRELRPDATEDEVAHFTRQKRTQLLRGRKDIDNLVGLLMTAVPKHFAGPDLDLYRERIEANNGARRNPAPNMSRLAAEQDAMRRAEEIWASLPKAEKAARVAPILEAFQREYSNRLPQALIAQNAEDRALSEFVKEYVAKVELTSRDEEKQGHPNRE